MNGESTEATDKVKKQFLHPDHWINVLQSRECDMYRWSVVRLRFGPVAASLEQIDRLALKENSHFTWHNYDMCITDSELKNNNTSAFEDACTNGMCP